MALYWHETKKLLTSAVVLGFVALCLAFNMLSILGNGAVAREIATPSNVFEGYQTAYISEAYINALGLSGRIAEAMGEKYESLQPVIEQKAQDGDSFGQYTYEQHRNIFDGTMKPLLFEGIIISIIVMLLALGNENINRTEQIVFSSKIGRRIIWHKFKAAVLVTLIAFALLVFITLAIIVHRYAEVLNDNVSSGFNYIGDLITGARPFATWHSFTVFEYLLAVIGISTGIVLCFSLAAFVIGTTIHNSYIGFIVLFLGTMFFISCPMILPNNSYIKYAFMHTPICLSIKLPLWFTDGGADILSQHFETWGVCISLVILISGAFLAANAHKRRDIL